MKKSFKLQLALDTLQVQSFSTETGMASKVQCSVQAPVPFTEAVSCNGPMSECCV